MLRHVVVIALFAAVAALASVARADNPYDDPSVADSTPQLQAQCDATYPARLRDAQRAWLAYREWQKKYDALLPKLEWFDAHCRFLTDLEIAIRKLDEPNPFVCDPKAKGRPKGLTAELVLEQGHEYSLSSFFDEANLELNVLCSSRDYEQRVRLNIPNDLNEMEALELVCEGREMKQCDQFRAAVPSALQRGKFPASRIKRR